MRWICLMAVLGGCDWIDEDSGRLDFDEDGFHVRSDCNDRDPDVTFLRSEVTLTCGARHLGDVADGFDVLQVANCIHPFQEDDLTRMGWREQIFRFVSEDEVDVELVLETDEFLINRDVEDTAGVVMMANRSRECRLDTCATALPLIPEDWRDPETGVQADISERDPYSPVLSFHARAGEAWYIIVSGGAPDEDPKPSPYRLKVNCPTAR